MIITLNRAAAPFRVTCCVCGWLAAGCGDDASATPSAATRSDAGAITTDAGAQSLPPGTTCSGELPVMKILDTQTFSEVAPDWSCYEQTSLNMNIDMDMDTGQARSVTFSLAMSTAATLASIDGVTADLFFTPSTLGTPAASVRFRGTVTTTQLDVPAGVTSLSVHVHALHTASSQLDIAEIRDYDLRIPASNIVEGTSVLAAMERLAVTQVLAGQTGDPQKAYLASDVRDCLGRDVGGAQFELLDGETGEPIETGSATDAPHAAYSRFALPDAECTFTTIGRAEWILINAPVNVEGDVKTHSYRLRLKGRMRAQDKQPVVLGEREVELFPGAATAVRLYRQNDSCEVISSAAKRCR